MTMGKKQKQKKHLLLGSVICLLVIGLLGWYSMPAGAEDAALKTVTVRYIIDRETTIEEWTETITQTDAADETYTVTITDKVPESNIEGAAFDAWSCLQNELMYEAGDVTEEFSFAEYPEIEFYSYWMSELEEGTYELKADEKYIFAEGIWKVEGDKSLYYGGMKFYVPEDGTYIISKGES